MPKASGKPETIHKTVRLTREQIDFIESQGQDTFTANLDHLLNELQSGESERVRRMQYQQEYLRQSGGELSRLWRYVRACRSYCSGLEEAMENAADLEKLLSEDGASLPASRPGKCP